MYGDIEDFSVYMRKFILKSCQIDYYIEENRVNCLFKLCLRRYCDKYEIPFDDIVYFYNSTNLDIFTESYENYKWCVNTLKTKGKHLKFNEFYE